MISEGNEKTTVDVDISSSIRGIEVEKAPTQTVKCLHKQICTESSNSSLLLQVSIPA